MRIIQLGVFHSIVTGFKFLPFLMAFVTEKETWIVILRDEFSEDT
jgi:uncharacterized protein with PQ loop repeat